MRLKQLVEQDNIMFLRMQLAALRKQITELRQQNGDSHKINELIKRADAIENQLAAM